MTTRKSRKIRSSLKKKGFKESNTDHFWYVLHFHGKKTSIRTKISFGKMEYDDHLLRKMAGQLRISKEKLLNLIDCPMGQEEYCEVLIENGSLKS